MKLDETKKILTLFETGKGILTFIDRKLPSILACIEDRTSDTDKHRDGFEYGDNVQSFNLPQISYYSFTGSYGSSNTYSDIAGLDASIFKEYFLKYLNKNKNEILREVGSLILEDAERLKLESMKELEELYKFISTIGKNESNNQ